jgi:hypothetical protein
MNIKKIAKWKILVGIWALLLIPFYVANSMYFPFISGKNFVFRIIIELIFAVWVYLAFVDVRYRPKFSWVALATGVFVLVMAVADFFSVNPAKAFWSNFERMDGWITLIHLFMFLLVAGSVMKTEKIWLWLFRSVVVSPFLFIVYEVFSFSAYIKKYNLLNPNEVMKFTGSGYMEHMGLTGERWAGPTGNPIYLAILH